jgi:hypothetical protein
MIGYNSKESETECDRGQYYSLGPFFSQISYRGAFVYLTLEIIGRTLRMDHKFQICRGLAVNLNMSPPQHGHETESLSRASGSLTQIGGIKGGNCPTRSSWRKRTMRLTKGHGTEKVSVGMEAQEGRR